MKAACKLCNKEFTKNDYRQIFCNRSCATKYNNSRYVKRKRQKECKCCGAPILAGRKYCSVECFSLFRKENKIAKEKEITKEKEKIHNNILIEEIVNSSVFRIEETGEIFSRIALNGRESKRWRKIGNKKSDGYIRIRYKNAFILVHRIVFRKFGGLLVDGLQINHINGMKHDNHIGNLEQVTQSENCKHAYRNNLRTPTVLKGRKNGKYKHGKYSKYGDMV